MTRGTTLARDCNTKQRRPFGHQPPTTCETELAKNGFRHSKRTDRSRACSGVVNPLPINGRPVQGAQGFNPWGPTNRSQHAKKRKDPCVVQGFHTFGIMRQRRVEQAGGDPGYVE